MQIRTEIDFEDKYLIINQNRQSRSTPGDYFPSTSLLLSGTSISVMDVLKYQWQEFEVEGTSQSVQIYPSLFF